MIEKKVVIRNRAGIHCRPSGVIISEAEKYTGTEFKLIAETGTSSIQSILELLSLGLQQGDEAVIQANGGDEEKACAAIAALLEKEFDFPPKTEKTE